MATSCCHHFRASLQCSRAYSWLLFSPLVTRRARCPHTVRPYDPNLVPAAVATLPPQLPFPKCSSPQRGSPPPAPHSLVPSPPGRQLQPGSTGSLPRGSSGGAGRGGFSPLTRPGEPRAGRLEPLAAGSPCGLRGRMPPEAPRGEGRGEQRRPCRCCRGVGWQICEEKEWRGLWPCIYL